MPAGGPGRAYYEGRKGDFFLSELTLAVDGDAAALEAASHSFGKISIGSGNAEANNVLDGDASTGWSTATREGEPHQLVVNLAEPVPGGNTLELGMLFERHFAASLGRFRVSASSATRPVTASSLPGELVAAVSRTPETWTEAQRGWLEQEFLRTVPELSEVQKAIDKLRGQVPQSTTTMVMQERPADNPRPTHRHHRGEYLSTREEVTPGIPAVLAAATEHQPTNRLEFAQWLVSDANPLVARVTANRAWRALFGAGLMRTSGDFGTQSDPPTHPELLDWLACELVQRDWSMKSFHRLLVTSATYQQRSDVSDELLSRDPDNRLWSRGPRHRLEAEMVRDGLLAACGLLSPKRGGPGVRPPQPESVTALAYGGTKWNAATGEDRYRRSIYTFAKRTTPFAAYAVFDAPSGEICEARRGRSNSPLQALTLLNDAMFVEMGQALAREISTSNGNDEEARIVRLFRRLLTRPPTAAESEALSTFRRSQLARLAAGELDAVAICGGETDDSAELASWVMTVRAVMNLGEGITKQ